MFGHWRIEKSRVRQEEEDREGLLSEGDALSHRNNRERRTALPWWGVILLLVACSSLSAVTGVWAAKRWLFDPDAFCTRHTSQYSPVVKDVDMSYHITRFNGSLLKADIYRQDAGPEVDAAWTALGADYRALAVPPDQAEQSGLLSDQVKISQKYGGGFPANIEGLHHLHCLNLLRKSLYYNFEHYQAQGKGPFSNDAKILKFHISKETILRLKLALLTSSEAHCLDILRQQLMCTIDIGVLGQVWLQPKSDVPPEPFVDFNTRHKCRDFEAVRSWAEPRQLPEHVPDDFLEPPKSGDKIYTETP